MERHDMLLYEMVRMISFLRAPQAWLANVLLAVDELKTLQSVLAKLLVDHLIEPADLRVCLFEMNDGRPVVEPLANRQRLDLVVKKDHAPIIPKGSRFAMASLRAVSSAFENLSSEQCLRSHHFSSSSRHCFWCSSVIGS